MSVKNNTKKKCTWSSYKLLLLEAIKFGLVHTSLFLLLTLWCMQVPIQPCETIPNILVWKLILSSSAILKILHVSSTTNQQWFIWELKIVFFPLQINLSLPFNCLIQTLPHEKQPNGCSSLVLYSANSFLIFSILMQ